MLRGKADVFTTYSQKLRVDEYELLATLDNRTKLYLSRKDGKHYPVDKIQVGINYRLSILIVGLLLSSIGKTMVIGLGWLRIRTGRM